MKIDGSGKSSAHLTVLKDQFRSVSDKWKSKWHNRKVSVESLPEKRIRKEAKALTRDAKKELKARSAEVQSQLKKVEKYLLKKTDYRPANGLEWKLSSGLDPEVIRFQEEGSAGIYRDIHLMLSREAKQLQKAQEQLASKKEEIRETLIQARLPEKDLDEPTSITAEEEPILLEELTEFLSKDISGEMSEEDMAELETLALAELREEQGLDEEEDDDLNELAALLAEIEKDDSLALSPDDLELLAELGLDLSTPETPLKDQELGIGDNVENFTPQELEEMLKDPELKDLSERLVEQGKEEAPEDSLVSDKSPELAHIRNKLQALDLSKLSQPAKKLPDQPITEIDEAVKRNRLDSILSDAGSEVSDSNDSGYDSDFVDDLDDINKPLGASLKREDLEGILDQQQLSELFSTVITPAWKKHIEQEDIDALLLQAELRLQDKSSLADALKDLAQAPELKGLSHPLLNIARQAEKGTLPDSLEKLEGMLEDAVKRPTPEFSPFQRKNAVRRKKGQRQPPTSPPLVN